jgi:outer membrane lipoprotein SlyB
MNTATTTLGNRSNPIDALPDTTGASKAKPLWAAIGVLSICVLALGASLIHINKRSAEPVALTSASNTNALMGASQGSAKSANNNAMITEMADGVPEPKTAPAPQKSAPTNSKNTVKHATSKGAAQTAATPVNPAATSQAATQPVAGAVVAQAQAPTPAPAAVCTNCGTVEAVTPVTRQGKGSGVGVVAGGVAGAVLGNQVGKGDGRTAATILGALGGGWAGNTIEKNVKKTTVYSVRVRMEDGSTRSLEEAAAPAVGAKVTVDGNKLRAADGTVYAPAPEPRAVQQPQRDVNGG